MNYYRKKKKKKIPNRSRLHFHFACLMCYHDVKGGPYFVVGFCSRYLHKQCELSTHYMVEYAESKSTLPLQQVNHDDIRFP